jgi:4-hydroxy-tetrahydrodipicolinate synthase
MNLKGLGVAMVTPFRPDGTIDFESIPRVVEHIVSGQADYLVVLGTTAEVACLSANEKRQVVQAIVSANQNRLPLVIGIGGNNTAQLVAEIQAKDLSAFGALLSVSPYYNKPTQEGIYHHFAELAKASPLPIIVYNVPSRTGSSVQASTFIRLAQDFENIIAIKEASGSMLQAQEIIKEAPSHIQVISGDDALTLPMLLAGAVGTISVLGNAMPIPLTKMFEYVEAGNLKKAYQLHYELLDMIQLLFEEGNPTGIKALMEILKICSSQVRLPLVSATSSLNARIEKVLEHSIYAV